MEKVQKKMMAYFCMSIATVLLLVIFFETNIFPTGVFTESKSSEFVFLTMMEIVGRTYKNDVDDEESRFVP